MSKIDYYKIQIQNETFLVNFPPCALVEMSPLFDGTIESGDGGLVKDNFQEREREGGKEKDTTRM